MAGHALPEGMLKSLVCDGIIAGVGSVLVFLPQIMILFLFIILLEDVGYMARAAFLLDKIMGEAGLHGRAFIPLLSSFACAIPGIMATRVIDNRRDRLTTILQGAADDLFGADSGLHPDLFRLHPEPDRAGRAQPARPRLLRPLRRGHDQSALAVAWVLRKVFWRGASEPFLMELPTYKA